MTVISDLEIEETHLVVEQGEKIHLVDLVPDHGRGQGLVGLGNDGRVKQFRFLAVGLDVYAQLLDL